MTRRLANPRGSPCHRCPAFASFPPSRHRASGRALSREPRDPGLPFRPKPEEINDERPGRHKKNPPEQRSGGSVGTDFRSHIRRDRSHVSRWRSRTAHGRSDFRLSGRIGTAWRNSHQASGTIPERGGSLVGLVLIVNRQTTKTQSRRDVALRCGGEGTPSPSPALARGGRATP